MVEIVIDLIDSGAVKGWQTQLADALNKLKTDEANASKSKTTYDNATEWEAKLRGWEDSLTKTAELTQLLETELTVFNIHLGNISTRTEGIVQAIDNLFCQVKRVFYNPKVKEGAKYPSDIEILSAAIQKIQKDVYCLGNPPNLNKNGGFLKKITELEAKLKVVEDMRDDMLKKLIALVQSINLMREAIGSNANGLRGIIGALQQEFGKGGNTQDEAGNPIVPLSMPTNCGCHSSDSTVKPSCDSTLAPVICFPLLDNDAFVKEIRDKHAASLIEKGKAEDAYTAARNTYNQSLARKNALEKAIAAATAAKK